MDLRQFNGLDTDRKSHLVWAWGFYISNKKEGEYNRVLFYLENFYVEVKLNIGCNRLDHIEAINEKEIDLSFYGLKQADHFLVKKIIPKIPEYLQVA